MVIINHNIEPFKISQSFSERALGMCTCGREGTAGLEVGKARVSASGVSGFCSVSAGGGVTFGFSCASMTSNAAGKGQKG